MGRTAQLRERNGYWITYVKGTATYFGKVAEVSRDDAERAFREHVGNGGRSLPQDDTPPPPPPLTVNALAERFLAWVSEHRGVKAHKERSRHVQRFRDAYGDVLAVDVDGTHVEAFTAALRKAGHAPDYVGKHLVSVGAMFHRGVKRKWLPPGVNPFASVEPIRPTPKALTESDLITDAEVRALFDAADADTYKQMGDVLRLYHATGARTSELLNARVGDFQRATRQIVLGKHKRSHTMKEAAHRTITLNAVAYAIVERRCEGRDADAYIFVRPKTGKPMTQFDMNHRFRIVRKRAKVREGVTPYSFRHLWISEALMAGVDVLLVARMAGTSARMIERVYGHFRNQSLADAQTRLDAERQRRGAAVQLK